MLTVDLWVTPPGDAPVRLNFEDGRVIRVVELDLRVPELGRVDVHHDWCRSWNLSRWSHTHYLPAGPPVDRERKKTGLKTSRENLCNKTKKRVCTFGEFKRSKILELEKKVL